LKGWELPQRGGGKLH